MASLGRSASISSQPSKLSPIRCRILPMGGRRSFLAIIMSIAFHGWSMMQRVGWVGVIAGLLLFIGGCAQKPPQPLLLRGVEPMGLQMVRTEAQMKKYPFRILQEFEHAVDLAFVQVEGPPATLEQSHAHTGRSSAVLEKGTRTAVVKLPSLLSGVKWPGQWTLVGAYFFAKHPQRMRAAYEVDGKPIVHYAVELPANQWTPLLLDIAAVANATTGKVGLLRLSFTDGLAQPIWCDNVILLNNTESIVEAKNGKGWSIEEKGFRYTVKL